MTDSLDLKQLAVDRSVPQSQQARKRRRPVLSRFILPAVLLAGFVGLIAWAARDRFLGRTPVRVASVSVSRAGVRQLGTPLFQTAGWAEPRPRPVLVTALAEGVIEDVFVVEGEDVSAGQRIATLIDIDARLALEQAEVDRDLRQAELASAQADKKAAQARLEEPLHLKAALADAESALAQVEREQAKLPTLIEAADATVEKARKSLEGKEAVKTVIAGRVLEQARADYRVAVSQRRELDAGSPQLEQERIALAKKKDAIARQLELLVEENRQVADTAAKVQAAESRVRQAELLVEAARVRLDRMIIHAPREGRVLSVVARPGTRVMGLDPGGETRASTVVTLYDPGALQVRADVRLEDVVQVVPGQSVTIESAASRERITGHVLTATSQANIQKNTLEVKVAIDSPPSTLRPEMLVTATFLAPDQPKKPGSESDSPERLFIPRPLVVGSGSEASVWVAAHDSTARKRAISLGGNGPGELVEVTAGLNPTDRIISEGRQTLTEGERIQIVGDDSLAGGTVSRQ